MDLSFVRLEKVTLDKFMPADKSAVFSVSFEDSIGDSSFSERIAIGPGTADEIFNLLTDVEGKRAYKVDSEGLEIIIEDKDEVTHKLQQFIGGIIAIAVRLDKSEPKEYLGLITRINMMSVNF